MKSQEQMNRVAVGQREGLAAPPRILLWLIVGLFVLAIAGAVAGIYVFRNVLRPGQQQRIIDALPFMSNFVHRQPADATIPTVVPPSDGGISPDDLLTMPLIPAEETNEAEATGETTATLVGVALTDTPQPTETPTLRPSDTPTAVPTQEPTPEPVSSMLNLAGVSIAQADTVDPIEVEPLQAQEVAASAPAYPPQSRLFGFDHVTQTWNNCGPANITMALSYFSWRGTQEQAAGFLKPDREDKNVSPSEMVAYVNETTNVRAITRIGGDMDLLKQFLASGFPVLIETGFTPEGYDWLGHYRTVVAYDDAARQFWVYDSYLGAGDNGEGLAVPYEQFDRDWQAFNRVFIVLYLPEREGEVAAILGERADVARANELALETAQREARADPQNEYAWFNMGTALTRLGRWDEAAAAFDRATQLGLHFRMLWYQFGPFEAYFNVRRFDDVLALVNANLNSGGEYVEETYYWQGRVYAAQGRTQMAIESFTRALQHNPRYAAARDALNQLTT